MKLKIFTIVLLLLGILSLCIDPVVAYNEGDYDWYGLAWASLPFAIGAALLLFRKAECDVTAAAIFILAECFNFHFIWTMQNPDDVAVPIIVRHFISMLEFGLAVLCIGTMCGWIFVQDADRWRLYVETGRSDTEKS